MINWIKYDPENPPKESGHYIVLEDGDCIWTADYNNQTKVWRDDYNFIELHEVTHYAHINLPREDTDNEIQGHSKSIVGRA